jgi:hypothetical protein
MTVRTYINGSDVSACISEVQYARALNSEPLPGKLKGWGAPEMLVDFDRFKDGDDACLTIDPWTKETGDDGDGTDIVHEIDVTAGVHSLYLLDKHATAANTFDVSKTFAVNVGFDKYFRIKWKPVTSAVPASYIIIKLWEGGTAGTVIFWLKIDMSTGVVYYSTDGGATYSSALCTLTLDSVNYLRVYANSSVAGNGGIQSSLSATTGYTGSAGALLDNNMTAHVDTVEVLSTAAAHGFEGFGSYAENADIKNTTWWNNWNALCKAHGTHTTYTFKAVTVNGILRARFYKTVAETSYDNADWAPLYHPTTAATAANSFTFTMRFAALPTGDNLYIRTTKSTSPNTAATDLLAALKVTTAGAFGTQAGAALLTMAINTDYVVTVSQFSNALYDLVVNGTTYNNGGAHWGNHAGLTGWFTGFYFTGDTATLVDVSFHDLVTSWATAGPDVDPIEAYLYELWSDQTIDYAAQLRMPVNVLVDGKHSWRGYVSKVTKTRGKDTNWYDIQLKDLFNKMAKKKCRDDYKRAALTVSSATDNTITVAEDINPPTDTYNAALWAGTKGAIIKPSPGDNPYAADADSLKLLDEWTGDAAIYGTYSDTQTVNSVYEQFEVAGSGGNKISYATLKRVVTADTPISASFVGSGIMSNSWGFGMGGMTISIKNQTTGVYDSFYFHSMNAVKGETVFPFNIDVAVANVATYMYSSGGNWNVDVKLQITQDSNFCLTVVQLDYLRWRFVGRDDAFEPIEAEIHAVTLNATPTKDIIAIDSAPFVDSYLALADVVLIGDAFADVMATAASGAFDIVSIENPHHFLAQDMRGKSNFDVWKHCASIIGGYYYYQIDEESGKSTLYHVHSLISRRLVDHFHYADATEIDDLGGWVSDGAAGTCKISLVAAEGYVASLTTATTSTYTIPGASRVTECVLAIKPAVVTGSIEFQFKDAGGTVLYKVKVDADKKLTCYGASTNSGVIANVLHTDDYTLVRIVFTTTNAETSILCHGEDTYTVLDATRGIADNDITDLAIVLSNAADQLRMTFMEFACAVDTTSTAITIQPFPSVDTEDRMARLVHVRGKSDEYEVLVDENGDDEVWVTDESLLSLNTVKAMAVGLAAKFAADTTSIRVQPLAGNTNYHVGSMYEVVIDGTTYTERVLRRAEFSYNAKDRSEAWKLELDTGETMGKEAVAREFAAMQRRENNSSIHAASGD